MFWLFLSLLGCKKDIDTDTSAGAADDCGETAPEISSLSFVDAGPSADSQCAEESMSRLSLLVDGTDVDGDLHHWTMQAWYDDVVDGSVEQSGVPFEVYGETGTPCEVEAIELTMTLCLDGNPPSGETLEFGVIISDDQDLTSTMFIAETLTPNAIN